MLTIAFAVWGLTTWAFRRPVVAVLGLLGVLIVFQVDAEVVGNLMALAFVIGMPIWFWRMDVKKHGGRS